MAMSSFDIVRRAIRFQEPDRLPLRFEALGLNDTFTVKTNAIGTGDHNLRATYDEWQCLWSRTEMANMGQVRSYPLSDWDAERTYAWPKADAPAYYLHSACC